MWAKVKGYPWWPGRVGGAGAARGEGKASALLPASAPLPSLMPSVMPSTLSSSHPPPVLSLLLVNFRPQLPADTLAMPTLAMPIRLLAPDHSLAPAQVESLDRLPADMAAAKHTPTQVPVQFFGTRDL